jgi:hypothetical protein
MELLDASEVDRYGGVLGSSVTANLVHIFAM